MVKISKIRLLLMGVIAATLILGAENCLMMKDGETKPVIIPPKPGYSLVWFDEFEVDGMPDPARWTYENGFVRNQEFQWYQPENAFVKDGLLIIEGRRDTVPNPNYIQSSEDWKKNRKEALFTSASVTTKGLHQWTYGIFEIKARIQTENGLWPAIWTLGRGYEWPQGGEIDIMEYYDGNILANAAWAGPEPRQVIWDDYRKPVSSFGDPGWPGKFHIWKMEWTSRHIKIFVDNRLLNAISLDKTINQRGELINPFQQSAHYLLLNLAIGGTRGGDPSNTSFPSRFEIDYVRIYQKK